MTHDAASPIPDPASSAKVAAGREAEVLVPHAGTRQQAFEELVSYYRESRPPNYFAMVFVGLITLVGTPVIVFRFKLWTMWDAPTLHTLSSIGIAIVVLGFLAGSLLRLSLWAVEVFQGRNADPFLVGGGSRDKRIERVLTFVQSAPDGGFGMRGVTRQTVSDISVLALVVRGIMGARRIQGHEALSSPLAAHAPPIRDGFPLVLEAADNAFELCAILDKAALHNKEHARQRLGEPMAEIWQRIDALTAYADSLDGLILVQDRVRAIGERDSLDHEIDQLTGAVRGRQDVGRSGPDSRNGELRERVRALNQAADDLALLTGKPDLHRG